MFFFLLNSKFCILSLNFITPTISLFRISLSCELSSFLSCELFTIPFFPPLNGSEMCFPLK